MSLSIIIPTIGRHSLQQTIESIELDDNDEIIVVGDGPQPQAYEIVKSWDNLNIIYIEGPKTGCYGNKQRQLGMENAKGTHLMFIDDDDVYMPGALDAVRTAIELKPDRLMLFSFVNIHGLVLWTEPTARISNISTQQIVFPNCPEWLGTWGERYEGDYDFIRSTINRWPGGDRNVIWSRTILVDTRKPIRTELLDLPQGWFHHGDKILSLIEQYKPTNCVELGSWKGASAIAIARVIKRWKGTLTCIDTWMGDVNGGIAPGAPSMLTECASNIIAAKVAPTIRFIPSLTVDAALSWPNNDIDFLYIDADHSYESVMDDLKAWWPLVKKGGIIAGDDYLNPLYTGTTDAWDDFERDMKLKFNRYETPNTDPRGMKLIWGIK